MTLIISKDGKGAEKLDKSTFKDEAYLQNYITENPDSIPLYEIDKNIRLLILAREFPTNSGPIDAIGIDDNGEIYVIETKLYKNPDKRLVVAQVLDYGAALSFNYRDFNDFLQQLESKVSQHFSTNLRQKINDFYGLKDEQTEEIIENIKTNLDKGKFRFVVLMDSLEQRLKDLIVFLNQNSRFDIYGVELEYYKYKDFEIMIPKLFGAEVKKSVSISPAGKRRIWNEQDFISQIKERLKEDNDKIINLYHYFKETADNIKWGTGNVNGSFAPIFNKLSKNLSPISVYSDGDIYIKFRWLAEYMPKEEMEEYYNRFVDELRVNTNIQVPDDYLTKVFTISGLDVIANYDGLTKTIGKIFDGLEE